MRLYSWNVNGIRAAHNKGLLDWLAATRPDLLCLQETKAEPAQLSPALLAPAGYQSYWAAAEKKGYSGVASFSKTSVSHRVGLGIDHFDREGRVLVTEHDDFDLYNVYFPNGKASPDRLAYTLDFYTAFLGHINARVQAGRQVIFCGDVNTAHRAVDLARPKENEKISGFLPEERAHLDQWRAHGWVDAFRHIHPERRDAYSWWSLRSGARERNVGWRIDYFFVHESFLPRVKDAGIATDVMGADHCPVWLELRAPLK